MVDYTFNNYTEFAGNLLPRTALRVTVWWVPRTGPQSQGVKRVEQLRSGKHGKEKCSKIAKDNSRLFNRKCREKLSGKKHDG